MYAVNFGHNAHVGVKRLRAAERKGSMSTRQNIADDAQRHLLGVEECVAKLASWPDAAQAQPPATNSAMDAIATQVQTIARNAYISPYDRLDKIVTLVMSQRHQ